MVRKREKRVRPPWLTVIEGGKSTDTRGKESLVDPGLVDDPNVHDPRKFVKETVRRIVPRTETLDIVSKLAGKTELRMDTRLAMIKFNHDLDAHSAYLREHDVKMHEYGKLPFYRRIFAKKPQEQEGPVGPKYEIQLLEKLLPQVGKRYIMDWYRKNPDRAALVSDSINDGIILRIGRQMGVLNLKGITYSYGQWYDTSPGLGDLVRFTYDYNELLGYLLERIGRNEFSQLFPLLAVLHTNPTLTNNTFISNIKAQNYVFTEEDVHLLNKVITPEVMKAYPDEIITLNELLRIGGPICYKNVSDRLFSNGIVFELGRGYQISS